MLEIVAQVVPLLAMQDTIDKFVIMFVDNEPARRALAKGDQLPLAARLETDRGPFVTPRLAEGHFFRQRQ